jgi:hypothetical protein
MREKNIIIHGVNEIDSSEPSVRKQNDTKFVTFYVQTWSDLFDFCYHSDYLACPWGASDYVTVFPRFLLGI